MNSPQNKLKSPITLAVNTQYSFQNDASLLEHPLTRRMSPLQIITALAMSEFSKIYKENWWQAVISGQSRNYYATAQGDIDIMIRLSDQVVHSDFPLSPRDFHNSVHNAAPAYGSIITNLTAGLSVCSDGFMALDRTIHMAALRIDSGLEDTAFIIYANQLHKEDAIAQVLVLSTNQRILALTPTSQWCLKNIYPVFGNEACDSVEKEANIVLKSDKVSFPWMTGVNEIDHIRVARNINPDIDQAMVSEWGFHDY